MSSAPSTRSRAASGSSTKSNASLRAQACWNPIPRRVSNPATATSFRLSTVGAARDHGLAQDRPAMTFRCGPQPRQAADPGAVGWGAGRAGPPRRGLRGPRRPGGGGAAHGESRRQAQHPRVGDHPPRPARPPPPGRPRAARRPPPCWPRRPHQPTPATPGRGGWLSTPANPTPELLGAATGSAPTGLATQTTYGSRVRRACSASCSAVARAAGDVAASSLFHAL